MQLQRVIEELGYTAKEAKVYLAMLALGEAHVSDIAEKVKLPRTSVQAIVEKLRVDGIANFYVQRRYKYWVAESPELILASFRKREEAMRAALPAFAALKRTRVKARLRQIDVRNMETLRVLADGSAQSVLIANEHAEIVYVNGPWQAQFGYSLEEVQGENPRILQSGKTPRDVYKRMWESLSAGKMFQSDEIIDKRKDGSFFNLLSTIFPLHRGEHRYFVQILDDITARKRAEELGRRFTQAPIR